MLKFVKYFSYIMLIFAVILSAKAYLIQSVVSVIISLALYMVYRELKDKKGD